MLAVAFLAAHAIDVQVQTEYGPVVGSITGSVASWLGVRYAQPPGLSLVDDADPNNSVFFRRPYLVGVLPRLNSTTA